MAFFSRLLIFLFGIVFVVLFAAGVLFWLVFYVAFSTVRWLMTGQKPQVLMMWQQIQTMRNSIQTGQGVRWSSWFSWTRTSDGRWHEAHGHTQRRDPKIDGVEDVVMREVHDKRSLPRE